MLKIGIVENAYCKKYGFEKGLESMRKHGYEGLDYQEFVNTDTPLFQKSNYKFEQYLEGQRKAAKAAGVTIHQVHGPWRHPVRDATEADRAERFEKMAKCVAGAAILGAKYYVIHPIMPFGGNDEGHERESYEVNFEFMSRLCRVGRENGVIICFENMPFRELSMGSVQAVCHFVREINDNYFKICFDTGHCMMYNMSPGDGVRLIGKDNLCSLHIHDNDGLKDLHQPPFSGVINWSDFGRALWEIGYEGVISLETAVCEKLPDALREYEEIGLSKKAQYIAKLAEGEDVKQ